MKREAARSLKELIPMLSPEPQRVVGHFSGLLVVDLTHVLNGPFETTILCDRVVFVMPLAMEISAIATSPFNEAKLILMMRAPRSLGRRYAWIRSSLAT